MKIYRGLLKFFNFIPLPRVALTEKTIRALYFAKGCVTYYETAGEPDAFAWGYNNLEAVGDLNEFDVNEPVTLW